MPPAQTCGCWFCVLPSSLTCPLCHPRRGDRLCHGEATACNAEHKTTLLRASRGENGERANAWKPLTLATLSLSWCFKVKCSLKFPADSDYWIGFSCVSIFLWQSDLWVKDAGLSTVEAERSDVTLLSQGKAGWLPHLDFLGCYMFNFSNLRETSPSHIPKITFNPPSLP